MKKCVPGISLTEVLLAVLILGIAVTGLLGLQGTLVRGVFSAHAELDRIGFIRSFFVEGDKNNLFKQGVTQKKVLEDPELTMNYTQKKPSTRALASHRYLVADQIDAEWPTPFGARKDTFARLQFRPRKEKTP